MGHGCKKCSDQHISISHKCRLTKEKFVEKASKIHNNKYDYNLVEYKNNRTKIKIICPVHGIFEQIAGSHFKYGCVKCRNHSNKFKMSKIQFIELSNNIHNFLYEYTKVNFSTQKDLVTILCRKHGEFSVRVKTHLGVRGGCSVCFKENKINNYLKKLESVKREYEIIMIPTELHNKCKITVKCKRCNYIGNFRLDNLYLKSCKCHRSKLGEDSRRELNNIHNSKYEYYFLDNDIIKSNTKLKIKCGNCGKMFYQLFNSHCSGKQGCIFCKKSKAEKKITNFLDKHKITVECEKTFDNCRNPKTNRKFRFDFYLPSTNICIEYDGEQHFKGWRKPSKKSRTPEYYRYCDDIKTKYCIDNKIKLIRIKYTNYDTIENILENELLPNKNSLVSLNNKEIGNQIHTDSIPGDKL